MTKNPKRKTVKVNVQPIEPFAFMPRGAFTQKEATALLNFEVVIKENADTLPAPPLHLLGFIVGVLAINDEIELLVRFKDELTQVSKSEFNSHYVVVPD